MSEELLLTVTQGETRAALVDNGTIQEIHIERQASNGILGNIYTGKVVRVLPGMQAAFVDFGVQRTGFLHVSDIASPGGRERDRDGGDIRKHMHEGKKVIVQVAREPLGNKGARLTTQLSLSTRYLVMLPQTGHIGISQLIEEVPERERLQQVLSQSLAAEQMSETDGFILRTAAQGIGSAEICADLRLLKRLRTAVMDSARLTTKSQLLYGDLPLQLRTVRDLARPSVKRILVDSRESFIALREFCQDYVPELANLLEHYDGEQPLFDSFGVEEEIRKALEREVELASGGCLVIDQTEAMTTIDVNTGSDVGTRNLEETVFKTNLEAATTLARQLRLRNLGGIIIVDFIDMRDPEHRRQVLAALEKALQHDPVRSEVTAVSKLGLVEMSRKRTRESLAHALCEECPVCQGRGMLKTAETVCYEVFRKIMRMAPGSDKSGLTVLAAQAVVDRMLDRESATVADLERLISRAISFRVEPGYSQERFDIVLL